MKKSNGTFKKKYGMDRWSCYVPDKRLLRHKNFNKCTRECPITNKIYYQNNYLYFKTKSKLKEKFETDICKICYEKKKQKSLFTICCKKKAISKFCKNYDKIICSDCKKK